MDPSFLISSCYKPIFQTPVPFQGLKVLRQGQHSCLCPENQWRERQGQVSLAHALQFCGMGRQEPGGQWLTLMGRMYFLVIDRFPHKLWICISAEASDLLRSLLSSKSPSLSILWAVMTLLTSQRNMGLPFAGMALS